MPVKHNPDDEYTQELDSDDLGILSRELRRLELKDKLTEANIKAKTESGYLEAVTRNGTVSNWRKVDPVGYAKFRRKRREDEAAKQGHQLRPYERSTPERRAEQMRASKAKARLDPDYKAAERARNTIARAEKRAQMTAEEHQEALRIRREKRAAKKKAIAAT